MKSGRIPVQSKSLLGMRQMQVPSKRTRDRSSPGQRQKGNSNVSSILRSTKSLALIPNFDEVYKSVERTGGIGCSVSQSKFQPNKITSCASVCSLMESARKSINSNRKRSLSKHSQRNAILGEHKFKIKREVVQKNQTVQQPNRKQLSVIKSPKMMGANIWKK